MRQVHRQALVPQSPEQMYGLVNDIAAYPRFVPYCLAAQLISQTPTTLEAVLTVGRAGVKVSIGTRNLMQVNEIIEMNFVSGPFKSFVGEWRFKAIPLPHQAKASPQFGTQIELNVQFEFESRLLDRLAGGLFESTWNTLVDTFVARAAQLYPRGGSG
jgi:ribosome-associated toxin RatA of RatAB toxin-antitoxin module